MNITIRIGSRKVKIDLINWTLILTFFTISFQQTFGVSGFIYFLIDIPIVIMLVKKRRKVLQTVISRELIPLIIVILLSIVAAIIGAFINWHGIGNVIYGFYKHYRGIVYFICVYSLTNDESFRTSKAIIKIIFLVNIVFTLFQFFVLQLTQDYLGGFFGAIAGVNQYTNLFFVIISLYCIYQIMLIKNKKIKRNQYIALLGIMLLIAAMAEIKFFFVEIIVLLLVAMLFTRKKIKSAMVLVIIAILLVLAYRLMIRMFPEFNNLLGTIQKGGISRLIRLQQHYSSDTDMGRAAVFVFSNKYYLTNIVKKLFGLGMGSVTSSGFVNNIFWKTNNSSHYDQFTTSFLYIEQGIVGFTLYVIFYIFFLIRGIVCFINKRNVQYSILLIMSVVSSMLIFVYNNALLSQMCFLNYWCFATILNHVEKQNSNEIGQ